MQFCRGLESRDKFSATRCIELPDFSSRTGLGGLYVIYEPLSNRQFNSTHFLFILIDQFQPSNLIRNPCDLKKNEHFISFLFSCRPIFIALLVFN